LTPAIRDRLLGNKLPESIDDVEETSVAKNTQATIVDEDPPAQPEQEKAAS